MSSTRVRMAGTAIVAASLLAFGPALAQDRAGETWEGWLESEGGVTEEEWGEGLGEGGIFGAWDENRDGVLSEEEFRSNAYEVFDENDDNVIDRDEFAEVEDKAMWIISSYPKTEEGGEASGQ